MNDTIEAKNGGEYCILNPGICNIDFTKATEIKRIDGDFRCICRNRTGHIGFYESDENGTFLEPGRNDSQLLCCGFCGRIFNINTLEIIRGVYVR